MVEIIGIIFSLLGSLFWYAVIAGVVLLIIKLSSSKKPQNGQFSQDYAHGYWDGYQRREQEVRDHAPLNSEIASRMAPVEAHETAWEAPKTEAALKASVAATVAEEDAKKAKRDLEAINITLYVASFLLVAAAALFIGTSLPESVKFIGTWLITIAFYGTGLVLHGTSQKLRPAAVAFTGTGLALLPFTGIAMYNFVFPDAAACWFVTSLIGVVAFVFATVRLRSQVVAYFALAFMVSLTTSAPALLHVGFIWYFVALLAFASLVTIAATLFPKRLPEYFRAPIMVSSQGLVPLTLVASWFSINELGLRDYEIIAGITALYYGAVAASSTGQMRAIALIMARALASLAVLILSYDLWQSWMILSLALSVVGIVQVAISLFFLPVRRIGDINNEIWLWLGMALQVVAPLLLIGQELAYETFTLQLVGLLIIGVGASATLRRTPLLGFSIYSLALMPIVYGFGVLHPPLESHVVAFIFVALALAALLPTIRSLGVLKQHPSLRPLLMISYFIFTAEALAFSIPAEPQWRIPIWFVGVGLIYAAVYIEKLALLTWLPNALCIFIASWLSEQLAPGSDWQGIIATWILAGAFYAGYWLTKTYAKQQLYAQTMFWSTVIVGGVFALGMLPSSDAGLAIAAGLTIIAIGGLLALEGVKKNRWQYLDAALILATVALQRIVAITMPDLDWIFYTHWWAATFALLAYLYYSEGARIRAKVHLIIGLVFLSLFTGVAALFNGDSGVPYRMIFLLEHAALLVVGLSYSKKLLTIWGAVGVVLAILWLLAGFTFLLLLFIALGLIGFAVYKLIKKAND